MEKEKMGEISSSSQKTRNLPGDLALESNALRRAVFNHWFLEKEKRHRKLKILLKKKQELQQKQQKKENDEKEKRAKSSFQAWLQMKKESKRETAPPKEERENLVETAKDKLIREQEAKAAFEAWKAKKDELWKEQEQRKLREKQDTLDKLHGKKSEKQISFQLWKQIKDEETRNANQYLSNIEIQTNEQNKIILENRLHLASHAFNIWLAEKVFQNIYLDKKEINDVNDRPPWCPPGAIQTYV